MDKSTLAFLTLATAIGAIAISFAVTVPFIKRYRSKETIFAARITNWVAPYFDLFEAFQVCSYRTGGSPSARNDCPSFSTCCFSSLVGSLCQVVALRLTIRSSGPLRRVAVLSCLRLTQALGGGAYLALHCRVSSLRSGYRALGPRRALYSRSAVSAQRSSQVVR